MTTKFTDISDFKEHPTYYFGDTIAEICAPLFNNFPINHFRYGCVYREDSETIKMVGVISNKNWTLHYLQNNYKFLSNGKKIHSWSSSMEPRARKDAGINFGLYNGIILEKVQPDYIEAVEFASPTKYTCPIEICGDKQLLNQFLVYFKDKAKNILKTIEKEPLCFPRNRSLILENPDQPYDDFCQSIKTKRLPLAFKSQKISFTQREFEVLSLLIKGKSMHEIGNILQISQRTAETHLYNAKNKTKTFTANQLLREFEESLF